MAAVGDSVGHYTITGVIGRGAMATVYRAHDDRLNRDVALKLLDPGYSIDFIYRARFEREYRITALLKNDHIVPIYDGGAWGDQLYIAMMLVDGPNLAEVMKSEGPLELARVVSIVTQLADALDEAHSQRVIHRDVKPANVLMASHGQNGTDHVYLADFGLTLGMEGTHLTRTGGFMGTLAYTAPEQLNSAPIDGRADEYALAATTFQMLTDEMPYRRDNEMALVNAQLFDPPPLATDLRPDLPSRVGQVVARGMAKRPEDRYRSAGEFAKALAAAGAHYVAGAAPAPLAVSATAPTVVSGPRPRRVAPAAMVVGLIAAAGLGALVAFAAVSFLAAPPSATQSPALPTVPAVAVSSPAPAATATATAEPTPSILLPTDNPSSTPSSSQTRTPRPTARPTPSPTSTPTLTPTPPPTATPTPPPDLPLVADGNWSVGNSPSGVSGDPFVAVGEHHRRYAITSHCASEADCRLAVNTFDSDTGNRLGSIIFKWNGSVYTYSGAAQWYSRIGGSTCQTSSGDLVSGAYTTREQVHISPSQTASGLVVGMSGTKTISGSPTAAGGAAGCAPFAMTFDVSMSVT